MKPIFIVLLALASFIGSYVATWLHHGFTALVLLMLSVVLVGYGQIRFPLHDRA